MLAQRSTVRGPTARPAEKFRPQPEGFEQSQADPAVTQVGVPLPGEGVMVEIVVSVADDAGVRGLVRRLKELHDWSALSLDESHSELLVRCKPGSRSVARLVDAVESWLAADGAGLAAELWVGGRSYTMVGSTPRPVRRW